MISSSSVKACTSCPPSDSHSWRRRRRRRGAVALMRLVEGRGGCYHSDPPALRVRVSSSSATIDFPISTLHFPDSSIQIALSNLRLPLGPPGAESKGLIQLNQGLFRFDLLQTLTGRRGGGGGGGRYRSCDWWEVSLSLRLKDLLGPVTRVKKKGRQGRWVPLRSPGVESDGLIQLYQGLFRVALLQPRTRRGGGGGGGGVGQLKYIL